MLIKILFTTFMKYFRFIICEIINFVNMNIIKSIAAVMNVIKATYSAKMCDC